MAEPVRVRFHRSLYAREAIDRAVARFAALGAFQVEEHAAEWEVSVVPVRESLRDRIADELGNHVLAGSILARSAG